VWLGRDSHLDSVPGFLEFHLLKGPEAEEHTLYSSHTVWQSKRAFEAWTKSEVLAYCCFFFGAGTFGVGRTIARRGDVTVGTKSLLRVKFASRRGHDVSLSPPCCPPRKLHQRRGISAAGATTPAPTQSRLH
jgi:hypothetical protein